MFAHIPLALIVQFACLGLGLLLKVQPRAGLWLGSFAASLVCIEREITQHEYRWIEAYGHSLRANMQPFEGLKFWDWNAHSLSETAVAIGVTVLVAVGARMWRG